MKASGIRFVQGRNKSQDADGTKFGIAIHNTSNDGTAEDEASFATRRKDGISAHFYCDDVTVIQSLDTDSKAGHAGSGQGNQNAVAVEITGVNAWSREQWLRNVAWDLLGQVLAQVCRHYRIPVRRPSVAEMRATPSARGFYSHDDMRLAWGGTSHTDPGPGFPWDRLFAAVNAGLGAAPPAPTTGDRDDMAIIAQGPDGQLYLCNGLVSRPITAKQREDIVFLAGEGMVTLAKGAATDSAWTAGGTVRKGWSAAVFGPLPAAGGAVPVVDLDSLADRVAGRLGQLRFEATASPVA